jgi:hypothetical protein
MKAARRRERVLAEGLKRYRPRPVLKCDCDAAAGSEATGTKRCPRCDAHLPTTSFAVSRQNGLSSWCRSCVRGYRLERAGRGPLRAPRPRIADRARQQVAEPVIGDHPRELLRRVAEGLPSERLALMVHSP